MILTESNILKLDFNTLDENELNLIVESLSNFTNIHLKMSQGQKDIILTHSHKQWHDSIEGIIDIMKKGNYENLLTVIHHP